MYKRQGKESVEQAASLAKEVGTELKDLGFNINFAPVADLGLTYGRSYSTNPDEVVRYAGAVGKAYDEAGLWYSYKHFPGIGKTDVDLSLIHIYSEWHTVYFCRYIFASGKIFWRFRRLFFTFADGC